MKRNLKAFPASIASFGLAIGLLGCSFEVKNSDDNGQNEDHLSGDVQGTYQPVNPTKTTSARPTSIPNIEDENDDSVEGNTTTSSPMATTSGQTWKQFSHSILSNAHIHDRENATTALNLAAPFALILGPEALQQVYQPVFGNTPRKGSKEVWFNANATAARVANNPHLNYFSPEEYTDLGGTLLLAVWEPRQNRYRNVDTSVKPRPELDSQYLAALRKFLGDACRNLIDAESSKSDFESNLLYSGETVDGKKLGQFLRRLSGLPEGKTSNVDAYVTAFDDLLPKPLPTDDMARKSALRVAYQHLCVALASDIRVITR